MERLEDVSKSIAVSDMFFSVAKEVREKATNKVALSKNFFLIYNILVIVLLNYLTTGFGRPRTKQKKTIKPNYYTTNKFIFFTI
ncbi:hypothetical protein QO200_17190 [Flavobacterium sp. Arc3]|uniref:hypothetical protein n=1 Tax=Flavobacterium sp. Arc3 TaxID=3046686 RepID=UPI00352BE56A